MDIKSRNAHGPFSKTAACRPEVKMKARENNSGLIGGGRRGKRGERRECEFTCLDLIPFRRVIGSHGESARSGLSLAAN